jgi:hypothetical protein
VAGDAYKVYIFSTAFQDLQHRKTAVPAVAGVNMYIAADPFSHKNGLLVFSSIIRCVIAQCKAKIQLLFLKGAVE